MEAPHRETVHLLPTRALALLPADAAAALRAHATATLGGDTLCLQSAELSAALRACQPRGALLAGRVTGFTREHGELVVRLEGSAGRRSQRAVSCAALVGAGGASCGVRAALLGAAPLSKSVALWRGTSSQVDGWQAGALELARDAEGAVFASAVSDGARIHWSLLAPPLPPRAAADETTVLRLLAAVGSWPLISQAVASTAYAGLSCERVPEARAQSVRALNGVLLLGEAASGVASASMDDLATSFADAELLAQALNNTAGDQVAAAAAYLAAALAR